MIAVTKFSGTNYTLFVDKCENVMASMADDTIDLTVTSPWYDNLRSYGESFDIEKADWHPIIKELYRVTAVGGVVVWVVADATINGSETGTSFKQALWAMECGFRLHDTMIYHRENLPQNNDRYEQHFEYMFIFSKGKPKTFNAKQELCKTAGQKQKIISRHKGERGARHEKAAGKKWLTGKLKTAGNIWKYQVGKGMGDDLQHEHPATFPESLANDHIISWSNPGDLVFDPFLGSGTTGKMAIRNGRNFIGCDIEADYVDIARQRIENEVTAVRNRAGDYVTTKEENKAGQIAIWDI